MYFPHIFLFTSATSGSSIDINAIAIFNNQLCINDKDITIIKIQLFVNNVVHSLSSQCLHKIICKKM